MNTDANIKIKLIKKLSLLKDDGPNSLCADKSLTQKCDFYEHWNLTFTLQSLKFNETLLIIQYLTVLRHQHTIYIIVQEVVDIII